MNIGCMSQSMHPILFKQFLIKVKTSLFYLGLLGMFLMFTLYVSAQATDDARKKAIEQFRRFPLNIRFSQDVLSGSDYKMEKNDLLINEGSSSEALRTSLNISMPIYKSKMGLLTLGGFYNFHNIKFAKEIPEEYSWHPNMGREHHTWGVQSAYIYSSKLWDRRLTIITNFKGEFSEQGFERATGIAVGMLQIKETGSSSFGVGAVLLVNTTSPWPLFPFFTYRRKFSEKWSLDLMLPQLYVNYKPTQKDKISGGLSIFGEHFYINPRHKELPTTCMYGRSNFRPEIVYEHNLNALLKIFVKSGASICINSRLYSSDGNKRYIDISQKPSLFFQIGMSYGMGAF